MKQIINTDNAPAPVGPYNQSIRAGDTLYISGQIAIDPASGSLVKDSIEAETERALRNIGAILSAAGLDYKDVVKCSVFVTDMENYGRINAVYAKFFDEEIAPARELVEVRALPKYMRVEISAIATFS